MQAVRQSMREFFRLADVYYWKTAVLVAASQLGRQYRNSFLGMFWTVLQPLTMAAVYAVVMPIIMRFDHKDYVLFIVSSLPLWAFINNSLVQSGGAITTNGETLKRCIISSTVFPVAEVFKNAYIFAVSFTVMHLLVATLTWTWNPTVLLVPLFMIPVLFCVLCMAIAIAFVAPYLRDIVEILTVSMTIMIWFTPVLYPVSVLPAWAQDIMQWNPLFILMHPVQMLAYEGIIPGVGQVARMLVVCVFAFAFGYTVYRKCRGNFVYYL